ncbi:MAG: serine/threonine-protein kinase, partial [Planctomycetota bacterium]
PPATGESRESSERRFRAEYDILIRCRHDHVIGAIGWDCSPGAHCFVALQFCPGGTLLARIEQRPLTEDECRLAFHQVALAIAFLHERGVAHRDVKPDNVLMTTRDDVTRGLKLADFGLACSGRREMYDRLGTPSYAAPELAAKFNPANDTAAPYTNKVDVWALGVSIYLATAERFPFGSGSREIFHEPVWCQRSPHVAQLLDACFEFDPANRLSAADVLEHPWFDDLCRRRRGFFNRVKSLVGG